MQFVANLVGDLSGLSGEDYINKRMSLLEDHTLRNENRYFSPGGHIVCVLCG